MFSRMFCLQLLKKPFLVISGYQVTHTGYRGGDFTQAGSQGSVC